MRLGLTTYQMSEKEYNRNRMFFNIGYKASATAALTGLAGLVAYITLTPFGPEYKQMENELAKVSALLSFGGIMLGSYFGANYHANPPLKKED